MKTSLFMIFIISSVFCYAQQDFLQSILETDADHKTRQKGIDSLEIFLKKQGDPESLADFYHDLGNKRYYRNWKKNRSKKTLDSAITFTKMAYTIKNNEDSIDSKSIKKTLYNLAAFNNFRGNLFEAIKCYSELIDIGNPDVKTQAANRELAKLYLRLGEFHKAISRYDDIISFYGNDNSNGSKLVNAYIGLGNIYSLMGFKEYAREIALNISRADSIIDKYHIDNTVQQSQILQIHGNLQVILGNYTRAISLHDQLLIYDSNLSFENEARVINSIGLSYFEMDSLKKASKHFLESAQLDSTYSDPYENLGDLYLKELEFGEGMRYYQKAIHLLLSKTGALSITEQPSLEELSLTVDKLSLLNHMTTKAIGWLRFYKHDQDQNHLGHALATFKKADELIDIIKLENTEFQSKLHWREQSSKLYMSAIEACFLLNRPKDAYYFMERNKALLLLEDLTNEEAKEIFHIPSEKAQQEFDLKRAIFLSENALQENIRFLGADSLAIFKETIRNCKNNYEKFIDSLNETYPDYAKFKRKVDVLSSQKLKSDYISENKVALHFILNEEEGYGLLTTNDTTLLYQLEKIPELNNDIETLIKMLSIGDPDLVSFKTVSHEVFKNLIPNDIHRKIRGKHLTIIPDYTLQQLPFESLVTDAEASTYLIEDVEISYAYSTSLLAHNKKDQVERHVDWLGVAPVAFDDSKLPELFFSQKEVNSIAGFYPGETLLNGNATKTNFIMQANAFNIVHLATHADIGEGDNPWIAFNDSKMYLKEIYATKMNADMVVLSACNTSSGELKRGEGVMSLARGFFYSGAISVVSTLWPVTDEAGNDILVNFYKNLAQGDSKSKALQKAKLAYLDTTEEEELLHPYYWAGFVVLGDNSPVSDKHISPWLLFGSGLLGTGILFFGYKKVKAHRAAA